jgi:hypothetical protein
MDDQTLFKPYRLLTPQQRKTEALEKANKPLPALISRRMFIAAGVVGTVSVSISRHNLMAVTPEPVRFKWDSFLSYATLAAGIMGYGPVVQLVTSFISAVKAKDPQQAAAILTEADFLRRKDYLDPARIRDIPAGLKPSITEDGRIALPFLHSDGLNGIVSYILGKDVFSRLAGPTQGSIKGVAEILKTLGFTQKNSPGLLSPKSQLITAFSKFGESDQSENDGDRYKSDADAILRFFYRNTGAGTGQNDFVVENARDPISGKLTDIENAVVITY